MPYTVPDNPPIPDRLYQGQPTASYATLFTVPAATTTLVTEILVCNVTAGSISIDLSLVASGGTAGVTNNVIAGHVIPALSTVTYSLNQVLLTGGFCSAKASVTASLTVTISGYEFV